MSAVAEHAAPPLVRRRPSRAILLAGLLGGIATAAGIALTATSGWLIVKASEQPPILTLMTAIVGVRAFGMARVVFRYAERLKSHDAALAELADARARLYARLVPLTPARLGRRGRGEVLGGVVDDLTDVCEAPVRVTVPVIATAIAGAAACALTAWALPAAGGIVAAMLVAGALIALLAARLEATGQDDLLAARAETTAVATLVAAQATQLRAIGATAQALGWVHDAHRRLRRITLRQSRGRAVLAGGLLLLTGLATAGAAMLVHDADLQPGLKALLVLTPVALGDALGVLTDAARAHARSRAAARRVTALLDVAPAVADPGSDVEPLPVSAVPDLRLERLSAGWTPGARHLGPLDLDLPAGTRLAITGANGSGKSTLLAVLARHLDPSSGVLRMDGVDARRLPIDDHRAKIAFVDDDPHVFATTVRENLRLALPQRERDLPGDPLLIRALQRAGLAQWLSELPEGLDTRLGAGGRGVSGGERARLGIARALLCRRPVILLDEPVAHLDTPTARGVLSDLVAAAGERTVLMVTHHGVGAELFDSTLELDGLPRPAHHALR